MSKSQLNELSKYLRNFARNDLHDEALQLFPYCDNSLKKVEQNLQILVVKKLYQINREKNRKLEDKKNWAGRIVKKSYHSHIARFQHSPFN